MLHSPENAKDCICVTMQFYGFVPQHVLCLLIITFDLIGSSQLWVGETERFGPDQLGEEEVPGDLISVRRHLKGGRKECGACSSETFSSCLDVGLGPCSGVPDGVRGGPDGPRGHCQPQLFWDSMVCLEVYPTVLFVCFCFVLFCFPQTNVFECFFRQMFQL